MMTQLSPLPLSPQDTQAHQGSQAHCAQELTRRLWSRRRLLLAASVAALAPLPSLCIAQIAGERAPIDSALRALLTRSRSDFQAALPVLDAYTEIDLAPALIFALRFTPHIQDPIEDTLRRLTGETDRSGWFEWMLWQEAHPEVVPHAGFRDLKRDLFLTIDPNWAVFLTDENLRREGMKIRLEEIAWGGVRKDGIPSLDNPTLIAANEADYLREDDLVFGVSINGDVRAYPLRIMGWHEMFNEVIGGVPVALAYCTLCGSGILFETAVEGRPAPFVFGTSGFLYRSNKLMYDRETHSLWNQFTGKPVMGPLVDSGVELKQRPVAITTWQAWREQNPETRVLSLETGHVRDYGSGVVYSRYFASPDLMFPTNVDQREHRQKDYVYTVRTFAAAKAWPLEVFEGGRVLNDTLGGKPVVLIGEAGTRTVRAYERGDQVFAGSATALITGGNRWELREEELRGPNGERLARLPGHIAYWFAWNGYLGPEAELYTGG